MNISLKWVEDDVEKEEEFSIPISISSDADVGIYLDAKPSPLISAMDHTLSILVSNIGSYKIENVEVSLDRADFFEILNAQNSQYIGSLENDDFSTVQYKIRLNKVSAGNYPLNVLVKYKDKSGSWINKNISTSVGIRSADFAQKQNTNPLIYIVGAGLVLGIGYYFYKKRFVKKA